MLIIGCDFHPGFQQVAIFDNRTGEIEVKRLQHREEAEQFYRSLSGRVRVGMEACGHYPWFERLLEELEFEQWMGDAAAIRSSVVRKQKTDRRDAEHILRLLIEDRFPRIWVPSLEVRDVRQLLVHRHKQVQTRTRTKNQLQAMALSQGVQKKWKLWTKAGRAELEQLPLLPHAAARRQQLLGALDQLEGEIAELNRRVDEEVKKASGGGAVDDPSGSGAGDGVGDGADAGAGGALPLVQGCGQLLWPDSARRLQRRQTAAGQDQQTGQFVSALFAGGSGAVGGALRSAAETLLSPLGDAEKSWRCQGGRGRKLATRLYLMLREEWTYAQLCEAVMQVSPSHSVVEHQKPTA